VKCFIVVKLLTYLHIWTRSAAEMWLHLSLLLANWASVVGRI